MRYGKREGGRRRGEGWDERGMKEGKRYKDTE